MAGNWFDPNAFTNYGGRLLKGFRGNINDVLNYAKDTADIYRLNKIFGDPKTKIDMAKKAMDISAQNIGNARARAQQEINEYLTKQAKIQAQEDKAQVGRAKSVGTKGTYPRTIKMSKINKVNPSLVEDILGTPKGTPGVAKGYQLATPEQLANLAKTKAGGLWGILASPLGVAGLSSIPFLWETGRNWNSPGSNWQSRALDTAGSVFTGATTGLGTGLGTLAGHPIAGGVTGGIIGYTGASPAFKRAQEIRDAERDYPSTYLTEDQFVKNYNDGLLRLPDGSITATDAKGREQQLRDFYRQHMGKRGTNSPDFNIDDMSAEDWLREIQEEGRNMFGIDNNSYPQGSYPITNLQPIGEATTKGNTSLGINYPGQYLTSLNGASRSYDRVPSSVELLANLLGYGQHPQGQVVQPTVDNRDFTQRIYDRVDELRNEEDKPELRPKAEIDNIPQRVTNEQQPTANDIMLQRLAQLNQYIGQQPRYKDYDPIQRMWIAKAGGMTPYQVWGDYPNQNTRLKTLYDILGKEYEIRKDMEDRARLEDFRKKVILNYQGDPELQMIASDPELYKAYIPYSGIKDRRNYDIDMSKKEYDRNTNLIEKILEGNNTAYNTQLKADLGIRDIDAKTIGDILTNRDKASTLDLNKQYQYNTLERIADLRNRMSGFNNFMNNQVKLKVAEIGAQSRNPQLSALAQMVSSGAIQDDATVMAIYNALAQEAGLDTTGANSGIGSLFND